MAGALVLPSVPAAAAAFRQRLRRLPLRSWAEAARSYAESDAAALSDAGREARRRLREAVERSPEGAERLRRSIGELVAVAEGMFHRTDVRLMRKAALTAALALATRELLDPQDFALLYAPFEGLIPLEELVASAGGGS